jgi:cytochrome c peroxidase
VTACGEPRSAHETVQLTVAADFGSTEPVLPIATLEFADSDKIGLGRRLFESELLSGDGTVKCSDCHLREHGLADPHAKSTVSNRPPTEFNSPSLFNLAYQSRFTWSARFNSLEEHIDALITNPKIMRTTWAEIGSRLRREPKWVQAFRAIYGEAPSGPLARDALLAYETSLTTPNSPFDAWILGDVNAISEAAKQGYGIFKRYGCANCHQGAAVGGNMVARLGVVRDYFTDLSSNEKPALGRFAYTGRPEDLHVFRVPSLRNVALTAPYFHDGSAATLERAVAIMARYQLGRELTDGEVRAIVAFLEALTGEARRE